ncbi:MAG: hypothetical protein COV43_00695 [Deltaproteobacteria bacterium CG11_big_fil_rev_8_21_14_0_20_42_23]|nr:MAG: hypothetical protein COV43_00695 [Deltaproteobacteria bacterium CG11_big_fil_rev_8_21_14_0_20_42_23]PJC64535.1 MAG: hypothetical protein CO021_03680 [Deltaproteobacteria bacterium CG_4_9_14_0_2_um_filter_42_21]
MKKIVYLVEQPLDERNYGRFGIQTWIDKKWDVEIWDFTPWVHPRVWQDFIQSGRKLKKFSGYFPVASKKELKQRLFSSKEFKYFIDLTGENYRLLWTKILLTQKGVTRVVCATGSIPEPVCEKKSLIPRLKKVFATGTINSIKWMANLFFRKLVAPFMRPGLMVVSGEKSVPSVHNAHNILKAHNLDYDIYLKLKSLKDTSIEGYAVFIDQNYCFHSDFIFEGRPSCVTPKKYFPAVCDCLRKISNDLGVDFCIAAHPRSTYESGVLDYFEGIPIKYGRTAELLRDCKFVVCHDSTAIQLAVLFGKPLIFLTTGELAASFEGQSIVAFASEFGKSAINVERDLHNVDWKKELDIDLEKYAEYKKKYIKTDGSPELPFWEIVADHIEENVN